MTIDRSGCVKVLDDDGTPLGPYCVAAQAAAVARRAVLDAIATYAESALKQLDVDGDVRLARKLVEEIARLTVDDPLPERVPRDEVLLAIVRTLQDRYAGGAEADGLLEQAIAVTDTISGGGWLIVRPEGLE